MAKEHLPEVKHRSPYTFPDITDYSLALDKFIIRMEALLRRKSLRLKLSRADLTLGQAYLESVVEEAVAQEMCEYDRRHSADVARIDEAAIRMKADRDELKALSVQLDAEIGALSARYNDLKKFFDEHDPLHNGK